MVPDPNPAVGNQFQQKRSYWGKFDLFQHSRGTSETAKTIQGAQRVCGKKFALTRIGFIHQGLYYLIFLFLQRSVQILIVGVIQKFDVIIRIGFRILFIGIYVFYGMSGFNDDFLNFGQQV